MGGVCPRGSLLTTGVHWEEFVLGGPVDHRGSLGGVCPRGPC